MSEEIFADERGELGELAGALRAELVRTTRRGRRRLPRPELVPTPPRSPAAPAPAPPAAGPAAAPAAGPSASEPGSGPTDPARIREIAAGCADLASLRAEVARCEACQLCRTRTQTVFADGTEAARVMFIGEAPGADEDAQGVPFVGRAGQLLTDIITKGMRLERRDVYIANILKCRPPDNRDPLRAEKELCTGWLDRQIELVDPEVIIPLGRHAGGHLLQTDDSMGRMRGRVHVRRGRKVVATYHPAFLLRSPHMKKDCWQDIQRAMGELGISAGG